MKTTLSQDGLKRVDFKLQVRLTQYELAVLLTRGLSLVNDLPSRKGDDTTEQYQIRVMNRFTQLVNNLSVKEIKEIIADTILCEGDQTPHYSLSDSGLGFVADHVNVLLGKRFKCFGEDK